MRSIKLLQRMSFGPNDKWRRLLTALGKSGGELLSQVGGGSQGNIGMCVGQSCGKHTSWHGWSTLMWVFVAV